MASFDSIITKGLGLLDPSKSTGKTLMVLNAIGIAFAAASNTFAAATDKNTSAEDKKFLVPAGGATGVANIAIYLAMTSKLVKKLSGSFAEKVTKIMKDNNTFDKHASVFTDSKIAKMGKNIDFKNRLCDIFKMTDKKAKNLNLLENMKATLKNEDGSLTQYAKDSFKGSIADGLGVVGAFIGAVVGCAIITPILRDVSAYVVQKAREAKNPSLKDKPYRPYFDISHIRAGKYPYGKPNNQPLTLPNYMNFTNGRTRV